MNRQKWYLSMVQGLSSVTVYSLIVVASGAPFYGLIMLAKDTDGLLKLVLNTILGGALLPWIYWVVTGVMGLANAYKPKEFALEHLRALPKWIGVGVGIALAFLAMAAVTSL